MINQYLKSKNPNILEIGVHRSDFSKELLNILNSKQFDDKKNVGFLRRGSLNSNNKQSFLSSILLIYSLNIKKKEDYFNDTFKNDNNMIKYLKEIIGNIDNFVKTLTGDLKNQYYNPNLKVKIENYKDSIFYKKTDSFNKLVNMWESFIKYIDNNVLDHTILWDFVCSPNDKLFKNGCNLIILEDYENTTRMICPYNKQKKRNNLRFIEDIPSIILYKKELQINQITRLDLSKERNFHQNRNQLNKIYIK